MQFLKYCLITAIHTITGKTVVSLFGSTYVVSGNIVKRIR